MEELLMTVCHIGRGGAKLELNPSQSDSRAGVLANAALPLSSMATIIRSDSQSSYLCSFCVPTSVGIFSVPPPPCLHCSSPALPTKAYLASLGALRT